MANQEHLEWLHQGREAWMTWKWAHPDIQPDLSGANLRDIDLRGINFIKTNLSGADLYGNLLTNADLARANLSEANLEEADLSGARVVNANLTRANLTRALLEDTDLC
ncbi:MAG TPA: pentapeptide repeat-containing protein [Ktedonobacteraceae bacterium]|nr:pentapeptide repeat-containing protein [Ktedonobacteraceae bacterium]